MTKLNKQTGRPKKPKDQKRVRLVTTVAPETLREIHDLAAARGVSLGVILDIVVGSFDPE